MPIFAKGTAVRVKGLVNKTEHNGKLGTVNSAITTDGRFLIKLEDGNVIKAKAENLDSIEAAKDDDSDVPDLISSSDEEYPCPKANSKSGARSSAGPGGREAPSKSSSTASAPKQAAPAAPPVQSAPLNSAKPVAKPRTKVPDDDDDDSEMPDLVSSSEDEDTAPVNSKGPAKSQSSQPPPKSAAPTVKSAKANSGAAASAATKPAAAPAPSKLPATVDKEAASKSAAAKGSAPVQKEDLTKNIALLAETGRSALTRAKFEEARQAFEELVTSLEKQPSETKDFQLQLAKAFTYLGESYLQLGQPDPAVTYSDKAVNTLKNPGPDHDIILEAKLCLAMATKAKGDYTQALTRFQAFEKALKSRYGDKENELVRKARLAKTWCMKYLNLPKGIQVMLERTDKIENINRKGILMQVSSKLVVALDNGTDQIVDPSDFKEIRDDGAGFGNNAINRGKDGHIVDGMTVIIGGNDTSKDYGLEGVVLNTAENKQATGGKMCHIMLSDSQEILLVPIAHVLTGEAAKAAVARKKALKELEEDHTVQKIVPSMTVLFDVLRAFKKNSWGARRILTELKSVHPNWDISEKRLKKLLKDMENPDVFSREDPDVLSRANTEDAEQAKEFLGDQEGAESFAPKLAAVRKFIVPHLECPLCMEDMGQTNDAGKVTNMPLIIKICGHSLCDVCVTGLDKTREEAHAKFQKKAVKPSWPQCPTCNAELIMDRDNMSSCGVKNYLLCDVLDILHGRMQPRIV